MQNYLSWKVEHDEATRRGADLVRVPPLPMPIVFSGGVMTGAKASASETGLPARTTPQINGRDGKFFENRLTHTIGYRAVGRLLGRYGEGFKQGSAFAVGPRLVMTAGHCVHLDGRPITDLLFQPGFPALGRTILVDRVFVPVQWVTNRDFSSDVALLVTRDVISEEMWFGVKTDLPDPGAQGWGVRGYPGEPPFDGTLPFGDSGPSTNKPWDDGELRFSLNACDWIDLTRGASGGPWLHDKLNQGVVVIEGKLPDPRQKTPYANGLSSFFYERYPGIMISPQFGPIVREFLVQALADIDL